VRLTHRYFEQVKQADRLDQNGNGTWAHSVHMMSNGMKPVDVSFLHPKVPGGEAQA